MSDPLLVGVSVTGPTAVGVIVNVCAVDELENVSTVAVDNPPPLGVIVIVPVYAAFGVTVKLVDAVFSTPPPGPVSVNVVAGAAGVTEFDALDAALVPYALVAATVHVWAVPLLSPETVIGLDDPVPVIAPGLHVAVYPVMADPPVLPGAVKATDADPSPAVAVPMVGAAEGVA